MTPRLALAGLLLLPWAAGQDGSPDPAFAKIPFDDWLKESVQPKIRWWLHASHPVLAMHQRLIVEFELRLDGAELESRRGKGQLQIYFQVTDADGRKYQSHGEIDLTKVEEGVKASYIVYTDYAFVLPGEYRVAAAFNLPSTNEHGAREDRLRVQPLRGDPLAGSWYKLPPVEFLGASQPPETWFLPAVRGRLHLTVKPKHPVRLDIVANVSTSEQQVRGRRNPSWRPGMLIPAFKAFAQVGVEAGATDTTLVDVLRRKVLFRQSAEQALDWDAIRPALVEASAGTIDLKALEGRRRDLAFLISELNRRLAGDGGPRAVVLISNMVEFESGQDVSTERVKRCDGCRLFYVRIRPPIARPSTPMAVPRGGRRMGGSPGGRSLGYLSENPIDQIEPVLKPAAPRVFDIATPEQLRKAMAAILDEIARM